MPTLTTSTLREFAKVAVRNAFPDVRIYEKPTLKAVLPGVFLRVDQVESRPLGIVNQLFVFSLEATYIEVVGSGVKLEDRKADISNLLVNELQSQTLYADHACFWKIASVDYDEESGERDTTIAVRVVQEIWSDARMWN